MAAPQPEPPAPASPSQLLNWLLVAAGILALPAVVFAVVLGVYRHLSPPPVETPSTRRLHQIGQGFRAYAQDHGGAYPPSLSALARAEHLPADLSTCPSDAPGGPFEYVYPIQNKGLAEQTTPNGTVMAYEPPEANGGRGSHLLYADGSLVWVAAANLDNELRTGRPPPPTQEP